MTPAAMTLQELRRWHIERGWQLIGQAKDKQNAASARGVIAWGESPLPVDVLLRRAEFHVAAIDLIDRVIDGG